MKEKDWGRYNYRFVKSCENCHNWEWDCTPSGFLNDFNDAKMYCKVQEHRVTERCICDEWKNRE